MSKSSAPKKEGMTRTILVFGKDPRKSNLTGRCVVLVRDNFDLVGKGQILGEVLFAEPG